MKKPLLIFVILVLSCGCYSHQASGQHSSARINVEPTNSISHQLYDQLEAWKGTPYKMGGLSKKGIDCSGFVHLTFRNRLGISLPRTTRALSRTGRKVSPRKLAAGDLVFFRTGLGKKHVGIYLEDGRFIHASTSKGVMESDLDSVYWSDTFWMARRVIDN